jgi:hypothetical protein
MDEKLRCQSCGQPLARPIDHGTNSDGSQNAEYCHYCYQNGQFTQPNQTMEDMIQSSIDNMTRDLMFSQEKAQALANEYIPNLKRWKN